MTKRTFRHWTPRYIWNRIVEQHYRRRHPDLPWLTPQANNILETWLNKDDIGMEFGSGRSTVWFANRVGHITSVEHNREWFDLVSGMLKDQQLDNVTYIHHAKEEELQDGKAYVQPARNAEKDSLDFVLIDGVLRDECALAVLDKVKPGGVIIIDNINLHLPCPSFSPNTRSIEQGPANEKWTAFAETVKDWRYIHTTNGISDTSFFFKPH